MKTKLSHVCLAILAIAAAGCNYRSRQNDIVQESFLHKYGMPVTKGEWLRSGRNGQWTQLRKDGVSLTQTFEEGCLHGKTTITFPNSSTVHLIETFDQGKVVARLENYPSGVPCKEEKFGDGNANVVTWYEDGTPSSIEGYKENLLVSGEYRTPLNFVESRVEEGRGIRISRSLDGDLTSRDNIQNGLLAERITYYPNGEPCAVTPYENGLIHGQRLSFHIGGLPNTVEQWIHGKREGLTVAYQNGEKIAEIPYVHGQKNGIEFRFRDGEMLVEEVSWKNDIQHGPRKLFADGAEKTEWYHKGQVVSRNTFERMNVR